MIVGSGNVGSDVDVGGGGVDGVEDEDVGLGVVVDGDDELDEEELLLELLDDELLDDELLELLEELLLDEELVVGSGSGGAVVSGGGGGGVYGAGASEGRSCGCASTLPGGGSSSTGLPWRAPIM